MIVEPPTRTRFVALAALCLLAGILYLDRVCISAALGSIQTELNLSNTEASYVLMAFTLAYGLFEVPTGRWGDLWGARRVLTRISLWWSIFTALTGACTGLWTLLGVRFLFGAGEAGAFPNVARVVSRWFPEDERGRAQGIVLAASLLGGSVAPFLASVLIVNLGWRWTFAVFGSLGAVWAAGFWRWFRDDPAAHPSVNAAEAARIGRRTAPANVDSGIPWKAALRCPSVIWLSLIMACVSFNSYIYFSWYPKYLAAARGMITTEAGLMASMVLAFAAAGTLTGGWVLDRVVGRGSESGRRWMGGTSFMMSSMFLGCALAAGNPWVASIFTALSCFSSQFTQTLWWSSAIGISGRHVGALFGLMNSVGVFGAMSSQYLVGKMADALGSRGYSGRTQWDPIFYVDMGVLLLAGAFWFSFRWIPVEPAEGSLGSTFERR